MEVVMNKLKNLFAKIKSVKNIEIYVAVLLGIVVVSIVLIGNFSTKNVDEKVSSESYIDTISAIFFPFDIVSLLTFMCKHLHAIFVDV